MFLVHSSCGECVTFQVISILSGPISWHVLDMFKASNGGHRINMSVDERYSYVGMRFVRFSCNLCGSHEFSILQYHVRICQCPFDLDCERSTTGQVTEFPRRVPYAHSVFVQRTFCPFCIRYIFVLSVIHPLLVRGLFKYECK